MSTRQGKLFSALETLSIRLDVEDVRSLCIYLDIDYDNLNGPNKEAKIRELLLYLDRRDRISEIVEAGKHIRPDIPWKDLLFGTERSSPVSTQLLSDYPYGHFSKSFRDVISPVHYPSTGSVLNVVFGNIADVEQANVVLPINQDFDFGQRGHRSVLASMEKIRVGGLHFSTR